MTSQRYDPRRADEWRDDPETETPGETLLAVFHDDVPRRCPECDALGDEHDETCPLVRD